ncbi:MAG: hypothetical protein KDC33_05005 [Thermoleophilia bacterium]|nr:hypothetical protein [Thermoleophilia bacterium]
MPFLGTFPAYGGGPPPLASSVLESPAPARSVAGHPGARAAAVLATLLDPVVVSVIGVPGAAALGTRGPPAAHASLAAWVFGAALLAAGIAATPTDANGSLSPCAMLGLGASVWFRRALGRCRASAWWGPAG